MARVKGIALDIQDLFTENKITTTEALLLWTIDNMVRSNFTGCWASNKFLGKSVKVKQKRHVQKMLRHLQDLGLIRVVSRTSNSRVFATKWNDIEDDDLVTKTSSSEQLYRGDVFNHTGGMLYKTSPSLLLRNKDIKSNTVGSTEPTKRKKKNGEKPMPEWSNFNSVSSQMKESPSTFDLECAKRLAHVVQASRKVMRKFQTSKWATSFRDLRLIDKVEEKRITKVLDWYCEHMGEDYVPQAFSGEGFRSKWLQLEAGMLRDLGPEVEVSLSALEIVKKLNLYKWPKGSEKQLPQFVQISMDNYNDFGFAVDDYKGRLIVTRSEMKMDELLHFLLKREGLLPTKWFIEHWWKQVREQVFNWEEFSGDLKSYIFKPTHKMFQRYMRGKIQPNLYSQWDRLMKETK
jgi:hypothetical protein